MSEELKAAQARIACLEGEIAKRDEELAACRVAVENCEVFRARIVELEAEVRRWVIRIQQRGLEMDDLSEELKVAHTNISGLDDLVLSLQCKVIERDAELAAIKAQEPVAVIHEQHGFGWYKGKKPAPGTKLYAAPVTEAKAKGVVQWPDADEIMQMAFEEGQPADDASGYCFELEEFDLFIERLMSEVARLNATHVQQPKCKTCDDNGRIGGPSFYAPDEGGEPCPDCSAPVQQVSVPASAFASRAITHYEAALLAAFPSGSSGEVFNQWNEARRVLAAAPAAPAADASDVLDQAMYTLISIGYHENSGLVHELRQALAAHRAKGVV